MIKQAFQALLTLAFGATMAIAPLSVAHATTTFNIYGILSLTGGGAFLGQEEARSLGAFEQVVNQSGGINGTHIKFIIEDDASNASTAVQLAHSIIAKHVPLMFGPTLVTSCNAVAPLFKAGPVQYCFAPGVYPPAGSFSFASGASTKDLVVAALRYFRARGWNKIAIISSTDGTGQEGEQVINSALALPGNKGITVADRQYFNITDISIAAQMAHIAASHAQVLIAWTTGSPFGTVLHNYLNAGLSIPLLTNSGNISGPQMKQYAAFSPKRLYFAATRYLAYGDEHVGPVKSAQKQFFSAMSKAGISPDTGPAIAWDAGSVFTDVFRHVGLQTTAVQFHDYLEQLHGLAGINGTFDFRGGKQRGLSEASAIVVKWNAKSRSFTPISNPGGLPIKP